MVVDKEKYIRFFDIADNISHEFNYDCTICLIRVVGFKEGWYKRFEKIKIGDETITDDPFYAQPEVYESKIRDIPYPFTVKKGDILTVEHNNCIYELIIYIK